MKLEQKSLEKYNKPVPRYTSYPPANYFSDDYTEGDFINAMKASNNWQPENVSIYIHIPFCRKMCHYCGCNSSPMATKERVKDYIDSVKKEIKTVSQYIDKQRRVSQIHYGGGTPNSIPHEYITEINDLIRSEFSFIENPEIAIECNPAYLDGDYIDVLKKAKFNRFSMGIQDFNADVLSHINRNASVIPVQDIISYIKDGSPDTSVNLDFIYGLPGQMVKSFTDTIQKAIDLKPDRLVTFSYAHVPWIKKAQNILEKIGLPQPDEKINMFLCANELLKENGYRPIGLDHYVLESDELYKALQNHELHRNFQGYCTRRTTGQVYAFGISSISQFDKAYIQNTKSLDEYIESISKGSLPVIKGYSLNNDEIIVRDVVNELMCNKLVDWGSLAQRHNVNLNDIKSKVEIDNIQLKDFEIDGIIHFSDKGIQVTDEGMLFVRNVAALLDPLYQQQQKVYSKSV